MPGEAVVAVEVHGSCDARFAGVRDAFRKSFETGEVGAAVALVLDGRPVVDLWAGFADAARSRPWRRDTLVNVYSTTKGMLALCINRLVEAGTLDLDAPVARYWPDFARNGKAGISVRSLLTHQAGLPVFEESLSLDAVCDWNYTVATLEAQAPLWEPGTRHGYHPLTYGHLVGELLRRVDGRTIGAYLREEIAGPAAVDFHIGLSPEEQARCADVLPAPRLPAGSPHPLAKIRERGDSLLARAFSNPRIGARESNTPQWRGAEIPAGNGHGDALGLARVYGALASGGELDGLRLLGAEAVLLARTEQVSGEDAVLSPMRTRFGLGFFLAHRLMPFGPSREAFGHPGSGGSFAFADPEARLGFAYVMNQLNTGMTGGAGGRALVRRVFQSLGSDWK